MTKTSPCCVSGDGKIIAEKCLPPFRFITVASLAFKTNIERDMEIGLEGFDMHPWSMMNIKKHV
jgi:hypothetical protein